MRRLTWQDAGSRAMLPGWRDRVLRQPHMLRDYSVGWLPELVKYADRLGRSETAAAGRQLAPGQTRSPWGGPAGAPVAPPLAGRGWTAASLPGRAVPRRPRGGCIPP